MKINRYNPSKRAWNAFHRLLKFMYPFFFFFNNRPMSHKVYTDVCSVYLKNSFGYWNFNWAHVYIHTHVKIIMHANSRLPSTGKRLSSCSILFIVKLRAYTISEAFDYKMFALRYAYFVNFRQIRIRNIRVTDTFHDRSIKVWEHITYIYMYVCMPVLFAQ